MLLINCTHTRHSSSIEVMNYLSSLTDTFGLENNLMASSISASRVSSSLLLPLTLRVSLCRGRERSSCVRTPWSVGERVV